jgi:SAM-dependent methyltransferase
MKLILGGHWNKGPEGWTPLTERDQDITSRLRWADNSIDVIFTEHVVEHINFFQAIGFMRESLRVLKPGGIFRCVAPMVDIFTNPFKWSPEVLKRYTQEQMAPYYKAEIDALSGLGLTLATDIRPWLVDFLVRKHGHQFCWTSELMRDVLLKLGFSAAEVASPGKSFFDQATCIERTIRGIHGENAQREFGTDFVFDPESGVVEARK